MTGRSPSLAVIAAALAAALLVAACKPAAETPAQAPASPSAEPADAPAPQPAAPSAHAASDSAAITAFLVSTYGPAAGLSAEWTQLPNDRALLAEGGEQDGAVTRRVCAHEPTQYQGKPAVLLAVCGTPKDFGHSSPGITDFFLLQGQPLVAAATAHLQEFGSMGSAGEIDIERFGADLPGFIVDSGFTGQGYTTVNRTVLLPREGSFQEAGTFLSSMDDNLLREGCEDQQGHCAPGKAYDIEFDLDVDDSDPAAAVYPVQVLERGNACGKPVDARHTLTLDVGTLTYAVPAALRRELACESKAS